jgi:hypothetical protein
MEPLGLLAESRRTPVGKFPIELVAAGIDGKVWMSDEIRFYKMVHEPIPAWCRGGCLLGLSNRCTLDGYGYSPRNSDDKWR